MLELEPIELLCLLEGRAKDIMADNSCVAAKKGKVLELITCSKVLATVGVISTMDYNVIRKRLEGVGRVNERM